MSSSKHWRYVGDKNIVAKQSFNYHWADRGSRMYLCGCMPSAMFERLGLSYHYNRHGAKKQDRSKYNIGRFVK
jgi:hypothetical protein